MPIYTMTLNGITFSFVNPVEFAEIYNEIFRVHQYHFVASTATPFIIDCGANIGLSALYFKQLYPHAHILAFEPNPATFQLLQRNVEQNGLKDVQLVNAAVAQYEGALDFFVSKDHTAPWASCDTAVRNASYGPKASETIQVPTVMLSSFLDQCVDFLKIDIEGMETSVIKEIENHLYLVKELRIEFHGSYNNSDNTLEELLSSLEHQQFHYAFERERHIISLQQVRHDLLKHDPYLFMIYTHKQPMHLWYQSWLMPKAMRLRNRFQPMHSTASTVEEESYVAQH